jgi:hypothetical protein
MVAVAAVTEISIIIANQKPIDGLHARSENIDSALLPLTPTVYRRNAPSAAHTMTTDQLITIAL